LMSQATGACQAQADTCQWVRAHCETQYAPAQQVDALIPQCKKPKASSFRFVCKPDRVAEARAQAHYNATQLLTTLSDLPLWGHPHFASGSLKFEPGTVAFFMSNHRQDARRRIVFLTVMHTPAQWSATRVHRHAKDGPLWRKSIEKEDEWLGQLTAALLQAERNS